MELIALECIRFLLKKKKRKKRKALLLKSLQEAYVFANLKLHSPEVLHLNSTLDSPGPPPDSFSLNPWKWGTRHLDLNTLPREFSSGRLGAQPRHHSPFSWQLLLLQHSYCQIKVSLSALEQNCLWLLSE